MTHRRKPSDFGIRISEFGFGGTGCLLNPQSEIRIPKSDGVSSCLKRNIVIRARAWRGCGRTRTGRRFGGDGPPLPASGIFSGGAAEQDHIACADFGGFALVSVLIVPLASLETAFDVDEAAFG